LRKLRQGLVEEVEQQTEHGAYLAFSFLFVNYALFSIFVTIEVVILLTFVSSPPPETAAYRAIDTIVGAY
jgi:uncharacterized membrane protein YccC